ncbi:DNA-binding protein [Streptacidiphilus cavernicola]|uniref:DNA-binding protein n=1 Tax=Streptacidiphilus cavernicola TaxID=3342716 RepID=A0ABV6VVJ5_9ACTN
MKEQARRRRIPFSRLGGSYRFTAEHLQEIIAIFEERPDPGADPTSSVLPASRSPYRRTAAQGVRLTARPPRRARNTSTRRPDTDQEGTRIGIRREAR